jgi:hypothetical protein
MDPLSNCGVPTQDNFAAEAGRKEQATLRAAFEAIDWCGILLRKLPLLALSCLKSDRLPT